MICWGAGRTREQTAQKMDTHKFLRQSILAKHPRKSKSEKEQSMIPDDPGIAPQQFSSSS